MLFIHQDDPPGIIRLKLELANYRHYLLTTDGHRAELDDAIRDAFKRWDELNNKEVA